MKQITEITSAPLRVPTHWSPEQALAALECLRAMLEAIWALYLASCTAVPRHRR